MTNRVSRPLLLDRSMLQVTAGFTSTNSAGGDMAWIWWMFQFQLSEQICWLSDYVGSSDTFLQARSYLHAVHMIHNDAKLHPALGQYSVLLLLLGCSPTQVLNGYDSQMQMQMLHQMHMEQCHAL